MSVRAKIWGILLILALTAGPVRADRIDVATEFLDDGWVRYTYTVEDPTQQGLQSFTLHSAHLQELREITQPGDWIHSIDEERLTWARDVLRPDGDHRGEILVFSFESRAIPELLTFTLNGKCLDLKDEILGPGPIALPVSTTLTPEPGSLSLLAIGGLGWWLSRGRRREPG